ncbi:forkhead box protein N3-like protein, partial [Leptotrombidium deliense]
MGLNDTNSMETGDDDLTNLTWLQDGNLLQNISVKNEAADNLVRFLKEENENVSPSNGCTEKDGSNGTVNHKVPCSVPPVPYNPQVHIHAKPPYSFSSLIFMAIESSANKALPVKDIYAWIVEHFPYYQTAPNGWKNTVRHNLSLNKCFRKVDKAKDDLSPLGGKGSLWCVDANLRPNLLQAVRRTPAHIYPYMSTAKTNLITANLVQLSENKNQTAKKTLTVEQIPQQTLLPLLAKRLLIPITKISRESEEADAAESMLTLTQYNSSATNILIIEGKNEQNDAQPEVEDIEQETVTVDMNPTGDHNYFSRCGKSERRILPESDNENVEDENEEEDIPDTSDVDYETSKKIVEDESDEDGVKGAEALLKLASRNSNTLPTERHCLSKRIRISRE